MLIAFEQEIRENPVLGKISIIVYKGDFDKVDLISVKKMWEK